MDSLLMWISAFSTISAVGYLIYSLSLKIKLPPVLSLLVVGFALSLVAKLINLSPLPSGLISGIAVISLVIVIFSDISKFEVQSVNHFSVAASRLSITMTFLNIVFMSFFVSLFFFGGFEIWYLVYASIFALIASGSDVTALMSIVRNKADKVIDVLMSEAMLNTPITVLLPIFLVEIILRLSADVQTSLWGHIGNIASSTLISIGAGVFIGILFFRAVKSLCKDKPNFFFVIIGALLSYSFGEILGGSGVLSVGVLGFVFGNAYLRDKEYLHEFNTVITESLEIIIVLAAGFVIQLNLSFVFVLKSFVLFLVLVSTRYISILISMPSLSLNKTEKTKLAFIMPKGISVAAIVVMLWSQGSAELNTIAHLLVMTMFYSILFSMMFMKFYKKSVA